MKKLVLGLFIVFFIDLTAPLDLFGQDDIYTSLSKLFNEYDSSPTTISDRYSQLPNGAFSHSQIKNIPASSQTNLLNKVLIIVDSPLSYYLASERITVAPSSGSFTIPVGDHCILNAPTVEISGEFLCPSGSTLEILNEGCKDNCDE